MNTAISLNCDSACVESIAAVFARGVLRLRRRNREVANIAEDSVVHGLDHCSTSRPCGVDAQESVRKDAR